MAQDQPQLIREWKIMLQLPQAGKSTMRSAQERGLWQNRRVPGFAIAHDRSPPAFVVASALRRAALSHGRPIRARAAWTASYVDGDALVVAGLACGLAA
ncbi:hypothetical protein XACN24_13620 [Xanthomonas albilineans]|uniref:hypothetical protein n=1 Tax=Xanthomonas albilineans TaxID=29447 RepID=UPI0013A541D9|nr:hypothetical protein [Xanthomonas albilineans]